MDEQKKEKYYITTAIAYTSRKPHAGNSYEIVMTDTIARYKRMQGYDVFFMTGTDEHGQKIEEYAAKAGVTPKEYVDGVAGEIKEICNLLNISYDHFIRTTDDYHERAVQKLFTKLYEQGDIYKGQYKGMYCTPCESFLTESQLVDGKCPDCHSEVRPAHEEAYFLRLSKYQKQLEDYIEQNPDFISPESRKNEMLNNFIKPGLQDLCVSRTSFKWGVPVEFDKSHVIYVWVDALSNYITGLGYSPDGSGELYKKYWPADVHVVGKDIVRFHSIYWTIILMALGEPLPKKIFGHPWMLFGTEKMSKSRGNVIYADDLASIIGVDGVRYYMLAEMPYASDGSLLYRTVFERYNSSLANNLGNLVTRTTAMAHKYFGGIVPKPETAGEFDDELKALAATTISEFDRLMNELRMSDAVETIFNLSRRSNKYIDETMPWILAKDPDQRPRLQTVIYNLLESIRIIAVLLSPAMPSTAANILDRIGADARDLDSIREFGQLVPGATISEPTPLFARLDTEKLLKDLEPAPEPEVPEITLQPEIAIDAFAAVELRVGQVLDCVRVPKSKKLLKLRLDDGMGGRQVLSGIAQWYTPEQLVGKKIVFVANLKPAKLMGEESCGMICAADMPDGSCRVVFANDDLPCGAKVH